MSPDEGQEEYDEVNEDLKKRDEEVHVMTRHQADYLYPKMGCFL